MGYDRRGRRHSSAAPDFVSRSRPQPMNLPAALFAVRWLVRDTFRQAWSSGILGLTLLATAVCVALCLSVSVVGERPPVPLSPGETREWIPRKEAEKLKAFSPPSVTGGVIDGVRCLAAS